MKSDENNIIKNGLMINQDNILQHNTPMRCFPKPEKHSVSNDESVSFHPILKWMDTYNITNFKLNDKQKSALAKLIPLLLCGEQSAVFVFNAEQDRIRGLTQIQSQNFLELKSTSENNLRGIESDEEIHEKALQFLLSELPKDSQQHRIKRLSQKFYTKLQQHSHSIAEHFRIIAQLDTCVCILMSAVANSSLKNTPLSELFNLIKKDEARHVSIAKKHSTLLNSLELSNNKKVETFNIQHNLVDLLHDQHQAFKDLDIDTGILFKRLLKSNPL